MSKEDGGNDDGGGSTAQLPRLAVTGALGSAFLAMGLVDALRGPTLLDLSELAGGVGVDGISYTFPAFSGGSIVGSLVTGYCFDRWPRLRPALFSASLLLLAASAAALPAVSGSLAYVCAVSAVQGVALGNIDAGGTVLCLSLWRDRRSDPFLYFAHFSYSAGSFLAPVLASPFLSSEHDSANLVGGHGGKDNLEVLYGIAGGVCLASFLIFTSLQLLVAVRRRRPKAKPEQEARQLKGEDRASLLKRLPSDESAGVSLPSPRGRLVALSFLCLFFFLYLGTEVAFGTFVTTFCVVSEGLSVSRRRGARVASVFYASQGLARGLTIFVSSFLQPRRVLCFSLLACSAGAALAAAAGPRSLASLEVAAAMLGAGAAPVFPAGVLWAEEKVERPLGGRSAAAFSIAGSAGAELLPLALGQVVVDTPRTLTLGLVAAVTACSAAFVATALTVKATASTVRDGNRIIAT